MSVVQLQGPGFWYPSLMAGNPLSVVAGTSGGVSLVTGATLDATAEKAAFIGTVLWDGRPTDAKTMGATSKIHIRTGAVTFADAGTTLRVGLQDVATGAGPPIQPDGAFDVYKDVVPGGGELSSSSDNAAVSFTLSTSGSKSVAHGDLVAVVFDMTGRGGSDSVILGALASLGFVALPVIVTNLTGTWAAVTSSGTAQPLVMLEASDGTFGILRGSLYAATASSHTFQSGGTEYGLIFQVPWTCDVDSVSLCFSNNTSANGDAQINLYSAPLGTPASMVSIDVPGEQGITTGDERWRTYELPALQRLAPNTDYCLAVKGTGSSNVELGYLTLGSASHRSVLGLANCRKGARTSGAFSETTTDIPLIAVGICGLDSGQPAPTYVAGVM